MASSVIGALRVNLGLDSAQFETGARRARATADATFGGINASAMRAAKALGAMAAATVSFAKLNSATQAYTEMGNSLRVLGMEEAAVTKKLAELGAMARATRSPLDATVKLYQRATMAGRDLGASQEQIMKFTQNVGLAMAQQGGSAASASGALTQLSQAIGGANIQAEEFNSLLDGAYPLVAAAARGIDGAAGSVGKLRAMVVDGQISSKEFFDAILSQSDALEAAFAATVPTVSQALGVLNDQFTLFLGNADASVGISSGIAQAILLLADNIDRVAIYAATAAAAFGGAWVVGLVTATMATAGLSGALGFLRVAIAKTGIGLLVVGAAEAVLWFLKLVKGAGSFGAALGLLAEVASEVWSRIGAGTEFVKQSVIAMGYGMQVSFVGALRAMAGSFVEFTWSIAEGINALFGTNLSGASAVVTQELGRAELAASGLRDAAVGAAEGAAAAFSAPLTSLEALTASTDAAAAAADAAVLPITAAGDAVAGTGGKAKGAKEKLSELMKTLEDWKEKLKTPVEKYREEVADLDKLLKMGKLSAAEYQKAIGMLNEELADGIPMVNDVANAFGDFIAGGLRDFKGFASSILDSFKSMISEMIATAARNKILIAMGVTGGGAAGTAAAAAGAVPGAAPGGMGSLGILGSLGGIGSAFMSGMGLSGSAFMSGGIGSMFSSIGAQAGTALATGTMTSIAATVGAIALPVAAVAAAFSFFKTKTKLLDEGIKVTVDNLDTLVYSFKKVEKSKFWGLSKSTSTSWDVSGSDLSDPIVKIVHDLQMGVLDAASALDVGRKAFRDFTASVEFSTKGMSQDEIMSTLQEKILELGDSFARLAFGDLSYLIKEGEGATEALSRLVTSMQTVNGVMDTLGHSFRAAGLAGAGMAADLVDLFGGLDAMASATSAYYQAFYTEQERNVTAARQAAAALKELGVAMPRTRDQYRAMIEAMDLTTDAGRQAYAALVGMSGVFDQILPQLGSFTAKIATMVETLTVDIDKMIGNLSDLQKQSFDAAKAWYNTARTLREFVSKMRGVASALISPGQARANSEARYQILLARAAAGDAEASAQLTGAADALIESAKATAGSALEVARVQARVLADIGNVASVADVEGKRHEIVAGLLGNQVDVLKSIRDLINSGLPLDPAELKKLTDQLGALSAETVRAMGGSVSLPMLEIKDAFKALPLGDLRGSLVDLRKAVVAETTRAKVEESKQAAIDKAQALLSRVAADQQKAAERVKNAVGAVNTFDSNTGGNLVGKDGNAVQAYVDANGKAVLNATGVKGASGASLDLWRSTFWKNGGLEDQMYAANKAVADANRALEEARKAVRQAGGIPAFASGGMHAGGLRLVGERGPEIEATGPSRIYSADKTRDMLGSDNAELVAEIRALRAEVARMRNENTQLALRTEKNTYDAATALRREERRMMAGS